MIGFGIFGYGARKLGFDVTPLVMAFILTPPLEYAIGQTILLSRGDLGGYLLTERPIAIAVMILTPILAFWIARKQSRRTRTPSSKEAAEK